MDYHHAMHINHPAFYFGHSGIMFEVSPDESVWFSVERFIEESEHIVLETFDDTLATNSRPGEMADCCVFLGPQGSLRNDIAARLGADGLADYHPAEGV